MPKTVCIVGCGFSGIATARVFSKFGYDITVYEKAPDVGGVWSKTRRYPGVGTQNTKDTYYLSEMTMPSSYPAWPSGSQVQAYLEAFVDRFSLREYIQVKTEVIDAEQDPATGKWTVTTRPTDDHRKPVPNTSTSTATFDVLIVCNGTFCDGFVPEYKGLEEFTAAGGKVCHTSDFLDAEDARGKDVVIVGYGKSACDSAVALSKVAGSTTVVARKLIWKLPKRIAGLCYKFLFLGRLGENLFKYIRPGPVMRLLHGPLVSVRNALVGSVEWVVSKQLDLKSVDAIPPGRFEDIARASISLVTEDFFESVKAGRIRLKRDIEVDSLLVQGEGEKRTTAMKLSNGEIIPAQIVCCGTGFHQRVPFLHQDSVMSKCTDERGNFLLYRFINPPDVKDLYFVGYNSSLFCPTSFEVAALWIVAVMEGSLNLPSPAEQKASAKTELDWMQERTKGKHSKGTNLVPFSLHNIDDMLQDLGIGIGFFPTMRQWLLPVDPSAYRRIAEQMLKKRLSIKKDM